LFPQWVVRMGDDGELVIKERFARNPRRGRRPAPDRQIRFVVEQAAEGGGSVPYFERYLDLRVAYSVLRQQDGQHVLPGRSHSRDPQVAGCARRFPCRLNGAFG